ncbi:MAG: hypothetical protein HY420_00305 [Candidatus Kerfeldbacteria bacterium]|nr:hypothetical protein [Candidatus Kerfeldbacteria bacterium]
MKTYRLPLADAPIQVILGIKTGVDSGEHEGIPLGISERLTPNFTVRLASGEIAPVANGGTIEDCIPQLAASKPGSKEPVVWLERTPEDRGDENASLVLVDGYAGFTILKGKPRIVASGTDTALIVFPDNASVNFIGRNSKQVVLFTGDNAREPKIRFAADSATRRPADLAPATATRR